MTEILRNLGVCVILRKHKCITSLQGQDESFPAINRLSLLSGRRRRRGPQWESEAEGAMVKEVGRVLREQELDEGYDEVFKNSRAVM